MKKPTKRRQANNKGPQPVPPAPALEPYPPAPSEAEFRMKQNAAEGRTGVVGGVKVLTRLQALELRSPYLQAKLFEEQYTSARDRYMAQFDRAPEAVETRQQIKEASNAFNTVLDAVHKEHGTSNETHVYDLDAKELRPKDTTVQAVPVADANPVPVAKEGSDAKEEGKPVGKGTTDT